MKTELISIVVPCYNEQEALPLYYQAFAQLRETMREKYPVRFELILVDDGSRDDTLAIAAGLAEQDTDVKYLSFSRNFGKEAGILAGLQHAHGDYVAMMDADLQDPPELLEQMYQMLQSPEVDCVATRRATRKGEPPLRSWFARMFYKLINKISDTEIVNGARDYRLMKRRMVDSILEIQEVNRFSKGIFSWVGYRTEWLSYDNIERAAGQTKWSFWKLMLYALDGIVAFSTAPLSVAMVLGLLFALIAMVMILVIIAKTLLFGDPVAGWPSTMCVIFLVAGVQMFCIGIIGQYLAKTYLETKRRPGYFVRQGNAEKYTRE